MFCALLIGHQPQVSNVTKPADESSENRKLFNGYVTKKYYFYASEGNPFFLNIIFGYIHSNYYHGCGDLMCKFKEFNL